MNEPVPAFRYQAPRRRPLLYPGKHPGCSYLLCEGTVFPILFDPLAFGSTEAGMVLVHSRARASIDVFLEAQGVAPLRERFAVVAYGSNAVPGQLDDKMRGQGTVPVVYGTMDDVDVVYNLISSQGYAFAELLPEQEGTMCPVAVTFLTERQLAVMIATEQNYVLAQTPVPVDLFSRERVDAYFFAGRRPIWTPNGYNGPVGVAEIPTRMRGLTALTQREMLALVIREFELDTYGIEQPYDLVHAIRCDRDDETPGWKQALQDLVASADVTQFRNIASVASRVGLVTGFPTRTYGR